jgi:hypothetical protein
LAHRTRRKPHQHRQGSALQKAETMNPKLEKLREQQRALETRIKKLEKQERDAARANALRLIERAGLLDLAEAELNGKLATLLKPAAAPHVEPGHGGQ